MTQVTKFVARERYRNIIFDLGNVLLEWNPERILRTSFDCPEQRKLAQQGIFQHSDWLDLDRGKLSEQQAIEKFQHRCQLSQQAVADLLHCVRQSLTLKEDTFALLQQCAAQGYQLYCLSNMSVENYQYLVQQQDFFRYFSGIVISGQVKMIKPELGIYRHLLQEFALQPQQSIFIDDMQANTQAAVELGLAAITFTDADSCKRELSSLTAETWL